MELLALVVFFYLLPIIIALTIRAERLFFKGRNKNNELQVSWACSCGVYAISPNWNRSIFHQIWEITEFWVWTRYSEKHRCEKSS